MTKKKYAVLWRQDKTLGITLNLPIMMFSTSMEKPSFEFKKIKDVELPNPMTSNQFNKFITSDEGKEWAKNIVLKEKVDP